MSTSPALADLAVQMDRADTADEVRRLLRLAAEGPVEPSEASARASLERRGFDLLQRLTTETPEAAAEVILEDLLTRCLTPGEEKGPPWPQYSELLSTWLEGLPPELRAAVRQAVHREALLALGGDNIPAGLRVLSQVGHSTPEVCARLEAICADRFDEFGDRALSVRTHLGVSPDATPFLLDNLHRRLALGGSARRYSVAGRIGTRATADLVLRVWLGTSAGRQDAPSYDDMFAAGALGSILSRAKDDELSDEAWSQVIAAHDARPDRGLLRALVSGVVSKFPTARVIPALIGRMPQDGDNNRWIWYLRLKECVLPVQSAGWESVPAAALEPVRDDAVRAVRDSGMSKSVATDQKEDAWVVLLCAGRAECLPRIDEAIHPQVSGYLVNHFLDLGGCIAAGRLPGAAASLLAAPPHDGSWSENEYLVAQVGAVRAAHGAMTDEAFDALLDYTPARGGILVSAIEALWEMARVRAEGGDRGRIETLLATAEVAARPSARAAAGAALAYLLERGQLSDDEALRLGRHAVSPAADAYTVRTILYAFASRAAAPPPAELLAAARQHVSGTRPSTDEDREAGVADAALALVAAHSSGGELGTLRSERLKLVESDGRVSLAGTPPGVTAYLLGRWYQAEPERHAPAVEAYLAGGDELHVGPLVAAIHHLGDANPGSVTDAVVRRTHRMDTGRLAEPYLLDLLAAVAPARLVADGWSALDSWLPQARAALAAALSRPPFRARAEQAARDALFIRLAGDGLFGVRRAAYRAFAGCSPTSFAALAAGWAEDHSPGGGELRRRAAEAARWVEAGTAYERLRPLAWDSDPVVREAFATSAADRETAAAAEFHLARVLAADSPTGIVPCWRHGLALGQLGDDQAVERLQQRSREPLQPSVRFWLERVRKAVQKRWDGVVRKWPEPWFTRRGRYEVVDGVIRWADGTETTVRAHLWLAKADRPNEYSSWGGWAEADGMTMRDALRLAFEPSRQEEELRVVGRSASKIIVTQSSLPDGPIIFSGNGRYPSATLTPD